MGTVGLLLPTLAACGTSARARPQPGAAPSGTTGRGTVGLRIIGLVVADLGRSLTFYRRLGLDVPTEVLAFVPTIAAFIASYLTPDKLVEYGRILRDSEDAHQGRHADNGDGIPDNLEVIPSSEATSDTKVDAVGGSTSRRALKAKQTDDWEG